MIIVSDTTILSNLLQADLDFILPALYQEVIIPNAVANELMQLNPALPETKTWLQVKAVGKPEKVRAMLSFLDQGESEAIVLAQELRADWLLMDERRGRAYARQLNLNITGTLGVLLAAKQAGLIEAVGPAIIAIQQKAEAWYQPVLVQEVLRQANEPPN